MALKAKSCGFRRKAAAAGAMRIRDTQSPEKAALQKSADCSPNAFLRWVLVALICTALLWTSFVSAQTPSSSDLQTLVKQLQEQVKTLQIQIAELKSQLESAKKETATVKEEVSEVRQEVADVREELKLTRFLQRGAKGNDVKILQEFLSQFPDIYPEQLVTGFFGPLTEAAIIRLQEKHDIEQVGIVGPKTLAKINELISEGAGESGVVPPGLLIASGIQQRIATATLSYATSTPLTATSTLTTTTPAIPAQPIGQTGTTTIPAVPTIQGSQATSTTTQTPPPAPIPTPTPPSTATTTATTTTATGDITAPTISNIQAADITASSSVITWTTDEPATSQVIYDPTTSYRSSTAIDFNRVTTHRVTLTGLTSSTLYHYAVNSQDAANNRATSVDQTVTTTSVSVQDTAPPVISNIQAINLTVTNVTATDISGQTINVAVASAVITWTTDEASDSQVEHEGPNATFPVGSTPDPARVTSHSISLSGLSAATTYRYRVKSKDAAGNLAMSEDRTFTTQAPVVAEGQLKWTFTPATTYNPPGAGNVSIGPDNTIYTGNSNGLFAVNPDGTQKWVYRLSSITVGLGTPSIASDGTIYVPVNPSGFSTKLIALDPDGTQKWTLSLPTNRDLTTPTIGADGTLYAGSNSFGLYAINADGTVKWTWSGTDTWGYNTPSLAPDGTIYIGSGASAKIYAVKGVSPGLANSPWPRSMKNNRFTSRMDDSLTLQRQSLRQLASLLASLQKIIDDLYSIK